MDCLGLTLSLMNVTDRNQDPPPPIRIPPLNQGSPAPLPSQDLGMSVVDMVLLAGR